MQKDWYGIAEQPALAPHIAHPEGCAALRIVLVTVYQVRQFTSPCALGSESASPARQPVFDAEGLSS